MAGRAFPRKIRKRDGTEEKFESSRIAAAVEKAAFEAFEERVKAKNAASKTVEAALEIISGRHGKEIPDVESVQDAVETALMRSGFFEAAKKYILYRERKRALRSEKKSLGFEDNLKLSVNALRVLKSRYLLKDDRQNVAETPSGLFRRTAYNVSRAEKYPGSRVSPDEAMDKFYTMMSGLEFMPNSPTLMNSGTTLGQLSACFVLPVEDSMDKIFESLKEMALIHQTGGGTGFSFSRLRPRGDIVSSTKGRASGPVSFMSVFDSATGVVVQGGRRRGANMGILRCDHPDIIEFAEAKAGGDKFPNFNISVAATDEFMDAARKDLKYRLINPRTGTAVKSASAKSVFELIAGAAWRTGDPGLVFLDEINRRSTVPGAGPIEATNPCGELPLLPYESCNLASLNLSKMVENKKLNRGKLADRIRWAVRFLDDVIDVNKYPLPLIRETTLANRKIGLGVMGFADALVKLGIPYTSNEAASFAESLMRFFREKSLEASAALGEERGVFPAYKKSVYPKKGLRLRNATVNTIAPTGSISMIAGCSSGIEPIFGVSYLRSGLSGARLKEINPVFIAEAEKRGIPANDIEQMAVGRASISGVPGIPRDMKRLFKTAFDVKPKQHLLIQAAFQKHTDNAVSKTINLPADAGVNEVKRIYFSAHALKCKGITVYRYRSKPEQVLSFEEKSGRAGEEPLSGEAGGCAGRECQF